MTASDHVRYRGATRVTGVLFSVPGIVAGALLVVSALTHLYARFGLNSDTGVLHSPAIVLAFAAVELALGLVLLLNPRDRWAVYLASVVFTAFAVYVGGLVYHDAEASCGCFARWSPPAATMFLVDCAITGGLAAVLVAGGWVDAPRRRLVVAAVSGLAAALPISALFSRFTTPVVALPGGAVAADASRWVGEKLPIAELIQGGADLLRRPRCLVLFASPDCPHCRTLLASLGPAWAQSMGLTRGELVIVWIRGPVPRELQPVGWAESFFLIENATLVVRVPTAVLVESGTVTATVVGVEDRGELEWLIRSTEEDGEWAG